MCFSHEVLRSSSSMSQINSVRANHANKGNCSALFLYFTAPKSDFWRLSSCCTSLSNASVLEPLTYKPFPALAISLAAFSLTAVMTSLPSLSVRYPLPIGMRAPFDVPTPITLTCIPLSTTALVASMAFPSWSSASVSRIMHFLTSFFIAEAFFAKVDGLAYGCALVGH